MKFLIYGGNGWIGEFVLHEMDKQGLDIVLGKARADNIEDLEKEIMEVKPTHVICLCGRTHGTHEGKEYTTIDYLEVKGKLVENLRDNLFIQMALGFMAKQHNFHLTCIATGCIYTYDDNHPFGEEKNGFTEYSLPNFFGSSYSIVKGYTDRLMRFMDNVLYCKIRMPCCSDVNKRNFITKIVTYEKVCSVPNSMTVLEELVPIMIDLSVKKHNGFINLCNPGLISHNEILEMYKEIVDPEFTWKNFSIEEQNEVLLSGRSNNFMDTTLLESLYPSVHNIKDAIRNTLIDMKEKKIVDKND